MISIVSWNIQCGRGVDGKTDFARIARVLKEFGSVDVICLQEVARFDPELDDGKGGDQVTELAAFFPEYEAFFGPALDRHREGDKHRRQFGNMVLSRLHVMQVFNHLLPQPAPPIPCKNMARQAIEVVVNTQNGPLRVISTHLEYHSEFQRLAQARYLCDLQVTRTAANSLADISPPEGPYAHVPRPDKGIICGDFNSLPDDEVFKVFTGLKNENGIFQDASRLAHPTEKNKPTCGLFDKIQWPEGPHCRDFFFLTKELEVLNPSFRVNLETDASDHQPIMLTLES